MELFLFFALVIVTAAIYSTPCHYSWEALVGSSARRVTEVSSALAVLVGVMGPCRL